MTSLASFVLPVLAQDAATGALDSFIGGLNYTPQQISVYCLLFAVIVILLVLGTEFWQNLWGVATAPSVAFSRIMGEQQMLPALFVVLMAGLLWASMALTITTTAKYAEVRSDQDAQNLQSVGETFDSMGIPGASEAFHIELDNPDLNIGKVLGFFLMVPITLAMFWYAWGIGILIAGKLIGMRNAAGVHNAAAGLAWPLIILPFQYWCWAQITIFGHGAAWALLIPLTILQLAWLFILAREFFRVQWVPTAIGLVLADALGTLVFALAFTFLVLLWGQLKINLPDYF